VPNGFCYPNFMSMDGAQYLAQARLRITSKIHAKGIFRIAYYQDICMQNGDESPLGMC